MAYFCPQMYKIRLIFKKNFNINFVNNFKIIITYAFKTATLSVGKVGKGTNCVSKEFSFCVGKTTKFSVKVPKKFKKYFN